MSPIIKDMTEITRCGAQYRLDQLSPMGLKACHASYLSEICDLPGITQDQLARRICINKSNVARQVAVLEEEGYVTRLPSATDKRAMQLYPTEKAQALLPQLQAMATAWQARLTQDLTEEELQLMAGILQKMKDRAAAYMEDR